MVTLSGITRALESCLKDGGVGAAIREYPPEYKKRYDAPVLCVGLKNGAGALSGFAEYLGEKFDPETNGYNEIYGKRIDLTFGLHIFSPKADAYGALGCLAVFAEVAGALSNLPSGLKVREIVCGETKFDLEVNMFHCEIELFCTACMYAVKKEDTEYLDFVLKGVLVN